MNNTLEIDGQREEYDEGQDNLGNERECEACSGEDVTTKADGECLECEEFMCSTCFLHHLKAKQCRKHKFDTTFNKTLPPDEIKFGVEKCKRHACELIKFFCKTHEIVGCGECMIPDHAECSLANIKDICKDFVLSEAFGGFENHVKDIFDFADEKRTQIQENKNANAQMYEKAFTDIRLLKTDINNYLDCAETKAREISDENDNRLTRLEKDCMIQSSKIAEIRGQLDPDLYSESGVFIQSFTLESIIQDIQQAVSRLQGEININEFNVVPDEHLQSFTNSVDNFGKIYCTPPPSTVSKEETTQDQEKPNSLPEDMLPESAHYESIDDGFPDAFTDISPEASAENKMFPFEFYENLPGKRVRRLYSDRDIYSGAEGTVTHVLEDGKIVVHWDAAGINPEVSKEEIERI